MEVSPILADLLQTDTTNCQMKNILSDKLLSAFKQARSEATQGEPILRTLVRMGLSLIKTLVTTTAGAPCCLDEKETLDDRDTNTDPANLNNKNN